LQTGVDLLDRAIEQDGHNATARLYRGWTRAGGERLEPAIADIEAGLDVSPLNQALLAVRAWLEICSGNPAAGEKRARDSLERRPKSTGLAAVACIGASLLGRHREAAGLLEGYLQAHPADPIILGVLAYAQAAAGATAEARETFAGLDKTTHVPVIHAAAALLAMGCAEEAIELLAAKGAETCPYFVFAAKDPRLAELWPEITRLRSARTRT
jgi:tetratricopeptide (TPR) repeat protein